jgi:hypothetical protein
MTPAYSTATESAWIKHRTAVTGQETLWRLDLPALVGLRQSLGGF